MQSIIVVIVMVLQILLSGGNANGNQNYNNMNWLQLMALMGNNVSTNWYQDSWNEIDQTIDLGDGQWKQYGYGEGSTVRIMVIWILDCILTSLLREASGIVRNKLRARLKESLLPRRVIALLILVTHLVWGRLVCRLRWLFGTRQLVRWLVNKLPHFKVFILWMWQFFIIKNNKNILIFSHS